MLATLLTGCWSTPPNTITIDVDGDGQVDALAQDADGDGIPDLDSEGVPIILPGSEHYRLTGTVDNAAPSLLTALGAILGVPLVGAIGAFWGRAKPARMISNLISSVQYARQKLQDEGGDGLLDAFDEMLEKAQSPELQEMVAKIKAKQKLPSVTSGSASARSPAAPK